MSQSSETIKGLKSFLAISTAKLEEVKERISHPTYRWSSSDDCKSDLEEAVVQTTVMVRLIEERNSEDIDDNLFGKLLLLFRYGYQEVRNINQLINKKPLNKNDEDSLLLSYCYFKEAEMENLLNVFLDKKQINRLIKLIEKRQKSK